MQVVCKDGTTIQCHDFEATDSGVLLFQEPERRESRAEDEEEEESADEERRATGFVPITELRFVLPDELLQGQARGQQGATREGGQPAGAPHGGPTQQHGGMAQQQQMRQQPGGPGQPPFDTGGQ